MARGKPFVIKGGPYHNTECRMITRTRFLFPSKDSDDFGTKPKHQLQAMVFYFHMCSAHCSRRKETADSGQDGALWTVLLRNAQHVGIFLSMFGNFSAIPCSVNSFSLVADPVPLIVLDLAMFYLMKLFPILCFLFLFRSLARGERIQ